jgi:hypothetical protein
MTRQANSAATLSGNPDGRSARIDLNECDLVK